LKTSSFSGIFKRLIFYLLLLNLLSTSSLIGQSWFGNLFKFEKSIADINQLVSPSVVFIGNINYTGLIVSHGTGFIVRENGIIVTNYHVIAHANNLLVKLIDGEKYGVDGIVFMDIERDIAILKISANNLPTVTIGETENLEVGTQTVAIGNPLGLEYTVSNGIISQIRSTIDFSVIQITTPITFGSSGGPLLNMYGEVIGITTAIFEGNGSIGFAIPMHHLKILQYENLPIQYSMKQYSNVYGSKPPAVKKTPSAPSAPQVVNNTSAPDLGVSCIIIGLLSLLLLGLISG
jgi:S1-C subfamily serine protease